MSYVTPVDNSDNKPPTGVEINAEFHAALKAINDGRHVFITGKAGTGKSTLLRLHRASSPDVLTVVAPTGVAALNVNGSTIHSFFGFPSDVTLERIESGEIRPRHMAGVIRNLDQLVIDEISMVRADLLDCIEKTLRMYGPAEGVPFGGVQMVFFGDLFQLPPVVVETERTFFSEHYPSPYFFSARCLASLDYSIVELQKIYRQHQPEFIETLNRIRIGDAAPDVLETVNSRLIRDFSPATNEFYITLTTTNRLADETNQAKLDALVGEEFVSRADVTGDFPQRDHPTAESLSLKSGAQVMLLMNDPEKRWVNGSLGVIDSLEIDGTDLVAWVNLTDDRGRVRGEPVEVRPHTWRLQKPIHSGGRLTYEDRGTFTQLPMRLAWAVTIHKSQGKTFDRVIVNLGRGTFAEGQLYVALSRCTSLEGLVLHSEVKPQHVQLDREVKRFFDRLAFEEVGPSKRFAALAITTTGWSDYDRIIEIAGVVSESGTVVDEFQTLVNPMRDVGAVGDHGVTASMVSPAPTFKEIWPHLARRIAGSTVVVHGLSSTQSMFDRESARAGIQADLGLGICTLSLTNKTLAMVVAETLKDQEVPQRALGRARLTMQVLDAVESPLPKAAPVVTTPTGNPTASRLVRHPDASASHRGDAIANLLAQGLDPRQTYLDVLSVMLDDHRLDASEQSRLQDLADLIDLREGDRSEADSAFVLSLMSALARDGSIDESDAGLIESVADALGTERPTLTVTDSATVVQLAAGMHVCFTGSVTDASNRQIERTEMEAMAADLNLIPVASVTKKKCDLLVVADPSSQSGKAKKAREFGITIMSATDFLEIARETD